MLTKYEKETIILFNEGEDMASIYTHSKTWQRHLEKNLGLKPIAKNGDGGKTYEIAKKRIKPPRAPRKLSDKAKVELRERLTKTRRLSPNS